MVKKKTPVNNELFDFPLASLIAAKQDTPNDDKGDRNATFINAMAKERARNITANTGIEELLQDAKMAAKILAASIVSPKDLQRAWLNIGFDNELLSAPLDSKLVAILNKHFKTQYNIEDSIAKILDKALFKTGSDVVVFLPPSKIDEIIAGTEKEISLESIGSIDSEVYTRHGIIDDIESKNRATTLDANFLGITDNLNILRLPSIKTHLNNKKLRAAMGTIDLEGYDKQSPMVKITSQVNLAENDRPIGFPWPSESIFPVSAAGDREDHLGYIAAIDSSGGPVSEVVDADYIAKLEKRLEEAAMGTDHATGINLGVANKRAVKADPAQFRALYNEEMDAQVKEALSKGTDSETIQVSNQKALYTLCLHRSLAKRKTRLLYIPKEFVSYIAFHYDDTGAGESLTHKGKVIASLRIIAMFQDMMAGVANSVPGKKLSITLDEDNLDAEQDIEIIIQEMAMFNRTQYPVGLHDPMSILDSLQASSMQIEVDGGDRYPGVKTELLDVKREYIRTDSEYRDDLKRQHISLYGVPVEVVDRSLEGDFATSVTTSNLMLARAAMEYQNQFAPMLATRIRKYISLDKLLLDEVNKAKGTNTVLEVLDAIVVKFPQADVAKLDEQYKAYTVYLNFVTEHVENYISDDMLRDLLDSADTENEYSADSQRAALIGYYMRQWCIDENVLPEITLLSDKDQRKDIMSSMETHYKEMIEMMGGIMKEVAKTVKKVDKKIAAAEPEPVTKTTVAVPAKTTEEVPAAPVDDNTPVIDDADKVTPAEGDKDVPGSTEPEPDPNAEQTV